MQALIGILEGMQSNNQRIAYLESRYPAMCIFVMVKLEMQEEIKLYMEKCRSC